MGRKLKHRLLTGEIFLLYVVYYSIGRFFLEGLKIDVWSIAGVPTARWISGIAIIASIAIIVYRRYRIRKSNQFSQIAKKKAP
jgi:phosphatidylglycerol:prolipoprotein diacylglycerol transferase